jgi:hypothetical protein
VGTTENKKFFTAGKKRKFHIHRPSDGLLDAE